MDTQIQEQLKVAKAAAAALVDEQPPTQSTVRAELEKIVKLDSLPADLKSILQGILKLESFEAGTTVQITVVNDPLQQTPTLQTGSIQALAVVNGDSAVAENLAQLSKKVETTTAELAKMVEGVQGTIADAVRTAIAKQGPATAKLEQIQQVLALKFDDEDEDWQIRCKVGDLVSTLLQFAAVERMMESSPIGKAGGDKSPRPAARKVVPWPADMARAQYDKDTGGFKHADPFWGRDSA
jgi:ubiquinone biosynthesis protein UbiJ